MKIVIENIIFLILKIINNLIPKNHNNIVFISRPDFSDNAKIMYDYVKYRTTKTIFWICFDKSTNIFLNNNLQIKSYYLFSIQGFSKYLRTKYIFTSSSSLWQIKAHSQKQYELWHGMPLKTVLCMGEEHAKPHRYASTVTKRFATSTLTKAILSACFDFNAMKIEVTGQPRTDALFSKKQNLKIIYEDILCFKKIILYMPTYRQGYLDKNEGRTLDLNIFGLESFNYDSFIQFLEKNNILFLWKLHPFEESFFLNKYTPQNNFRNLSHRLLINNGLDINEVLGEIDILVTDYSSIYIDFLLTDKKMIFLPIDLEIYKEKRGFILEPYEYWTPGPKVHSQLGLENEIISSKDEYSEQRVTIRNLLHQFNDGNSCERIWSSISDDF
ncbi:MAG TPA: hypothetical protein DCR40_00400 [Prolixibacteraceae bacterium]|nr:hypothetical protein [Prolixibacteraceae bacterium]